MELLPSIFSNPRKKMEREVALISNNVKKISNDSKKMGTALMTLNNNVALIDRTITAITNANFEKPIAFINSLNLDQEYKDGLIKELNGTKAHALATLSPLKEASEKIRGNMAVSMIKYDMMTRTLVIQKNVIESGTVQVEALKKAQELGEMGNTKIEELVAQAEEINNLARSAVSTWDSGSQQIKDTLQKIDPAKDFSVFDLK